MSSEVRESGSVTIWVIVLCSICVSVALGTFKLGLSARNLSAVQTAADASALSAAYDVAHSKSATACQSASQTAKKNSAILKDCRVSNTDVVVEVVLDSDKTITAKARAEIE